MQNRYYSILFLVILIFNCGDDKSNKNAEISKPQTQEQIINASAIETIDFLDFALSNEAEKEVQNWSKYQELAIQVNYLKKGDLSFFKDDPDTLKVFLEDLEKGLPETFKTNPIQSRINVLTTSILKLNDDLTLDNIPFDDKLFTLKQVLAGFSSLNYSIDEKLERDFYDKITPE